MVPCSYLRAFEPLDALPASEREQWGQYVASGSGITVREAVRTEAALSAARLLTGRGTAGGEAALVRRVGTRTHVCPLQLDLRSAFALHAFRQTMPDALLEAFLPDSSARAGLDELARSTRVPHIRDEPWIVPLEWFTLFGPDERHLVDPPEGLGPRLTYLAVASVARARISRAIEVVDATLDDDDILLALEDLAMWLDHFDGDTVIELDYGGVARLFRREELAVDRSCADVWAAVESLESGDFGAAAAHYGVARSRWTSARDLLRAN